MQRRLTPYRSAAWLTVRFTDNDIACSAVCFDASRLSRNSRDWASLFELCGHFDTLLRAALFEIIVEHQPAHERLELILHWQGGVHTKLHVKKRATPVGSKTALSLIETVRDLACLSDAEIAHIQVLPGTAEAVNHLESPGSQRPRGRAQSHRVERVGAAQPGFEGEPQQARPQSLLAEGNQPHFVPRGQQPPEADSKLCGGSGSRARGELQGSKTEAEPGGFRPVGAQGGHAQAGSYDNGLGTLPGGGQGGRIGEQHLTLA